jgi:hypothetical protein
MENWRNVCQWLEGAGYKNQKKSQFQSNQSLPVDAKLNVEKIVIENHKIVIGINLQIVTPLPNTFANLVVVSGMELRGFPET